MNSCAEQFTHAATIEINRTEVSTPPNPTIFSFCHTLSLQIKNHGQEREDVFIRDQWRKSGLTRNVFAQQHGITDSALEYWWRKRNNKIKQRTIVLNILLKFS